MIIVVALGILAVVAVLVLGRDRGDLPARIVAAATTRLPERRQEWGQAMAAELFGISGRYARWRFALGVARVALFPPAQSRARVVTVAVAGVLAVAAATAVTEARMPSMAVFVATLGVLLWAGAVVLAIRSPRRWTAAQVTVGLLALAGTAATVTTVVRVGLEHPGAVSDSTHIYSVLFAVVLAVYLGFALSRPRRRTPAVQWWAVGGAVATGAAWAVLAALQPDQAGGVTALLSPVAAGAVLIVSVCVAARARSSEDGLRAGVLTAILSGPILFALDMFGLLRIQTFTLTDPYDIAAFPHSGQPDAASYLLSDAIGGHIIGGLVLYPVLLAAVAAVGAAVGSRVARPVRPL
jgi:hypothetical protein